MGEKMQSIKISALDKTTAEMCAIRLVGGFDSSRTHTTAIDTLRFDDKKRFAQVAELAEAGCKYSWRIIEQLVIGSLLHAKDLMFDDKRFEFYLQTFKNQQALDYVVWEVIAQINED